MKKLFGTKFLSTLPLMGLLMLLASAPHAAGSTDADKLQTSFTFYLWLPTLDSDLKYGVNGGSATVDAGDILDALQMAFMGALEFRKDKWSLLADVIYLDLGDDKSSRVDLPGGGAIETNVDLQLSGWQLGVYGGYQLYQTDRASLEVLAGVRHLSLDTDATLGISGPLPPSLPTKNLSRSANIWDGVVGLRGRIELNPNWFVPYHADVGTGDSDITWQAMTGIGYEASWGDVLLVYRHLEWDQGGDKLIQGLSFSGPGVALKYRF